MPKVFFEVTTLYHFAFLPVMYESSICLLGVLLCFRISCYFVLELVVKETVYLGKINFSCLVST